MGNHGANRESLKNDETKREAPHVYTNKFRNGARVAMTRTQCNWLRGDDESHSVESC